MKNLKKITALLVLAVLTVLISHDSLGSLSGAVERLCVEGKRTASEQDTTVSASRNLASDADTSDCGAATCHFGHCSHFLFSGLPLSLFPALSEEIFGEPLGVISNSTQSLFRPPIC